MNFLAIDTSGKHLTVLAQKGDKTVSLFERDCALRHSVLVMDKIDEALSRADLRPAECDFFAAVVGPGSFTGIRIGISTVKGLCLACGNPALSVTSFDCIAYSDISGKTLALADAGHGFVYACGYDGARIIRSARYCAGTEAEALRGEYVLRAAEPVCVDCALADPAEGLLRAVRAKRSELVPAERLAAVYIRKSSAEERR